MGAAMPIWNLRDLLAATGKTQTQFASDVGITQGYASKLITGTGSPSLALAVRIARSLGVQVEELFHNLDATPPDATEPPEPAGEASGEDAAHSTAAVPS